MVNKVIQCTVKCIKRNQYPFPVVCIGHSRFFKQRKERSFPVCQMFAAGRELAHCSEHISCQLELIGNKGVYICKFLGVFI